MSLLLAAVVVATGVGTAAPAFAAEATTLPAISYIAPKYSIAKDNAPFTFALEAANYEGDVQYRIFVQKDGGAWTELTDGYTAPVNAKVPYIPEVTKNLEAGKYKASVWVKRANVEGTKKNSLGSYDTYYVKNFSIGTAESLAKRADLTDLGVKDTYKVGENIEINGKAGYGYKLHIYNPQAEGSRRDKWIIDDEYETAEDTADDYTFTAPGTYLVDVWGMTENSSAAAIKQGYDGWFLKVVTVEEADEVEGVAVETSVKAATVGSSVTVKSEYPGATSYQVFDGAKQVSGVAKLGEATTMYPANKEGQEYTVKLLDAQGAVLVTTSVVLGKTAMVKAPEVKDVTVKATFKAATVGSSVTVTADLEGAASYQVFRGEKQVSGVAKLGEATTMYPAAKDGETVVVKLLDAQGNLLQAVENVILAEAK